MRAENETLTCGGDCITAALFWESRREDFKKAAPKVLVDRLYLISNRHAEMHIKLDAGKAERRRYRALAVVENNVSARLFRFEAALAGVVDKMRFNASKVAPDAAFLAGVVFAVPSLHLIRFDRLLRAIPNNRIDLKVIQASGVPFEVLGDRSLAGHSRSLVHRVLGNEKLRVVPDFKVRVGLQALPDRSFKNEAMPLVGAAHQADYA